MYIKRDAETKLRYFAEKYPVVTVTGPRQSGKTTICRKVFPQKKYVSLEELDFRDFAEADPRGFLSEYSGGAIIDEIQRVPDLLSYIQGIVDENQQPGEFILTGSSQPELSRKVSQSLAGRTALLRLFPFSYTEIFSEVSHTQDWLNQILSRGFYPRIFKDSLDPADYYSAYTETYLERDVRQFSEIRDLKIFSTFLKLCAARVGQLLNYSNLSADCGVSVSTIKNWISILERSYVIFLLLPYHANLKKRLIRTPKLYFYDVGLCAYLNGAKRYEHITALPNRGSLFENFVISDVVKMNAHNNLKQDFYFIKNKNGQEIDLLIDDGVKILPIEVKSAQTFNESFSKNLAYYARLSKGFSPGYVVYAGADQNRSNYQVLNYYNFFQKFMMGIL
jgi:hypothetical protein